MKLFPELITRNWQLKLSACAMAVLLWTVPELGKEGRQVFDNVPVRVLLNDPQWAKVQGPLPATVRLTLTGPTRDLVALGMNPPSIVIPVDQVASSDTSVVLRLPWVRMSASDNVVVEEIEPNIVNLSFEAIAVGAVPLRLRVQGELPAGLSLARAPAVDPALTRVSGPRSRVEELQAINLQPLDLSLVERTGPVTVAVDTAGLSGLTFAPQQATVELVVEETVERVLLDVPLDLPPLPEDPQLQARPPAATVTLSGARSVVTEMDVSGIRVTFSRVVASALSPGEQARVSLSVEGLPPLVTARVEPDWILLRRPTGQ